MTAEMAILFEAEVPCKVARASTVLDDAVTRDSPSCASGSYRCIEPIFSLKEAHLSANAQVRLHLNRAMDITVLSPLWSPALSRNSPIEHGEGWKSRNCYASDTNFS